MWPPVRGSTQWSASGAGRPRLPLGVRFRGDVGLDAGPHCRRARQGGVDSKPEPSCDPLRRPAFRQPIGRVPGRAPIRLQPRRPPAAEHVRALGHLRAAGSAVASGPIDLPRHGRRRVPQAPGNRPDPAAFGSQPGDLIYFHGRRLGMSWHCNALVYCLAATGYKIRQRRCTSRWNSGPHGRLSLKIIKSLFEYLTFVATSLLGRSSLPFIFKFRQIGNYAPILQINHVSAHTRRVSYRFVLKAEPAPTGALRRDRTARSPDPTDPLGVARRPSRRSDAVTWAGASANRPTGSLGDPASSGPRPMPSG